MTPVPVIYNFEPSQPQRITSGLKTNFSLSLTTLHTSNQTTDSPKPPKPALTQIYTKHTQTPNKFFEELVHSILPLLKKKEIRLGNAGIMDPSVDLSIPDSAQQLL